MVRILSHNVWSNFKKEITQMISSYDTIIVDDAQSESEWWR